MNRAVLSFHSPPSKKHPTKILYGFLSPPMPSPDLLYVSLAASNSHESVHVNSFIPILFPYSWVQLFS